MSCQTGSNHSFRKTNKELLIFDFLTLIKPIKHLQWSWATPLSPVQGSGVVTLDLELCPQPYMWLWFAFSYSQRFAVFWHVLRQKSGWSALCSYYWGDGSAQDQKRWCNIKVVFPKLYPCWKCMCERSGPKISVVFLRWSLYGGGCWVMFHSTWKCFD